MSSVSRIPVVRASAIAVLALGALCVSTARGFAQLTRTPTGTMTTTTPITSPIGTRSEALSAVAMDPPAASLKAEPTGPGEVRLSWSAVSGISKYFVTGAGVGTNGLEVSGTTAVIGGIPGGRQEWAVASVPAPGGTMSIEKYWPRVAADMPFFTSPSASVFYETSAAIQFDFRMVREGASLKLFRTHGANPPVEVPLPATYMRQPSGAADRVVVPIFFPEMQPDAPYNFYFTATFPNAGARASEYATVTIPLFVLRTTVPPTNDRIIVEWNAFGIAPYTIEKGTFVQQGGGSFLAFAPIRDASGNPMQFSTAMRYEDLTIQRGATYRYKICANLPRGRACPIVSVTMP